MKSNGKDLIVLPGMLKAHKASLLGISRPCMNDWENGVHFPLYARQYVNLVRYLIKQGKNEVELMKIMKGEK